MARGRLTFAMPAASADAFEAFFNHSVWLCCDTLLGVNYVEGGGMHPYAFALWTASMRFRDPRRRFAAMGCCLRRARTGR